MGERDSMSTIVFTFTWLGIAAVVCLVVGIVAGLVRGDVPGTLGPVVQWGMTATAIGIVVALTLRRSPSD